VHIWLSACRKRVERASGSCCRRRREKAAAYAVDLMRRRNKLIFHSFERDDTKMVFLRTLQAFHRPPLPWRPRAPTAPSHPHNAPREREQIFHQQPLSARSVFLLSSSLSLPTVLLAGAPPPPPSDENRLSVSPLNFCNADTGSCPHPPHRANKT
jgi:hypothetical protein